MEKVVRKFRTHEDAEKADREYYLSLTPQERMKIFFELIGRNPDAAKRLERVYRIIKIPRR